MRRTQVALAVLILVSGVFVARCRNNAAPPPSGGEDAGRASAQVDASEDDDASSSDHPSQGVSRGVEARADDARRDAGDAIPAACDGPSVSLIAAVLDERCAVSDREWTALSERAALDNVASAPKPRGDAAVGAGEGRALRQEARREGDRIVLSLVNGGTSAMIVPLRAHPTHPEQVLSVLAEDDKHAVFELRAPSDIEGWHVVDVRSTPVDGGSPRPARPVRGVQHREGLVLLDAGLGGGPFRLAPGPDGRSFERVHSARIRLPPGGSAHVRFAVDPRVTKRLGAEKVCAGDASGCSPAVLPKGHYTLHVGQLIANLETHMGLPARVEWDAP